MRPSCTRSYRTCASNGDEAHITVYGASRDEVSVQSREDDTEVRFSGTSIATGVASGRIFVMDNRVSLENLDLSDGNTSDRPPEEVTGQLRDLCDAVETTRIEIQQIIQGFLDRDMKDAADIFASHLLILDDPEFVGRMKREIAENRLSVHAAVASVTKVVAEALETVGDEYLRARAQDVRDVGSSLLGQLGDYKGPLGEGTRALSKIQPGATVIVVADELAPSEVTRLRAPGIVGLAVEKCGPTSHSAILAGSLGIPVVIGVRGVFTRAVGLEGRTAIVDGDHGVVVMNPSHSCMESYSSSLRESEMEDCESSPVSCLAEQVRTLDGHIVEVAANVGSLKEAELAVRMGADGIGLLRTEFLFMDRSAPPSEDEQYEALRGIVLALAGKPITIRTLDVGGDKNLPYLKLDPEANPFLGRRGIRLALAHRDLLRIQLRAILRAACHGRVAIMFPMVTTVDEVRQAKAIVHEVEAELRLDGICMADTPEIGIMIEVPAAVLIADALAKEVDFFSLGTNDLTQYTMAVDRLCEDVAPLYQPLHPAVLRLVKMTVNAGHANGIRVGMCGELAGELEATRLLVGLGLDEFSVSVSRIRDIKGTISETTVDSAQEVARTCLKCSSEEAVRKVLACRSTIVCKRIGRGPLDKEADRWT